jgi:hypothetical protein
MIEEFVNSEINKHSERYGIDFSFNICSKIIKYVKEGVYAFQLIYNENHQVVLVQALDRTKVVQNDSNFKHWGQGLWSYDGGHHFKYSSIETLTIDIQKIRQLKLISILD